MVSLMKAWALRTQVALRVDMGSDAVVGWSVSPKKRGARPNPSPVQGASGGRDPRDAAGAQTRQGSRSSQRHGRASPSRPEGEPALPTT